MSKGIATSFRDRFGRIHELKSQNPTVGGLAFLKEGNRYILFAKEWGRERGVEIDQKDIYTGGYQLALTKMKTIATWSQRKDTTPSPLSILCAPV